MSFIKNIRVQLIFFKLVKVCSIGFHVSSVFSCDLTVEVELCVMLGSNIYEKNVFEHFLLPHFWSHLDTNSRILVIYHYSVSKFLIETDYDRTFACKYIKHKLNRFMFDLLRYLSTVNFIDFAIITFHQIRIAFA
jgi:hypothetical protein